MARFTKLWPPLISGLLVLACFPPFRLGLLVFVALVPWLMQLREADGKRAFRSGMVFGFVFWLGEFSFVAALAGHWTGSLALGMIPWLLGCFLGSFYFALFAWLASICYRRKMMWGIPLAWVGVEVFRSYIIGLAFPFGFLAMPLTPFPVLIQSAHFGTVFFTSAWVILCNLVLAELFAGAKYTSIRWYAASFGGLLALSIAWFGVEPDGDLKTLAAGQPGVDMAFGDQSLTPMKVGQRINEISWEVAGADLLVLPEGIARSPGNVPEITFDVNPALPIIFGGQRGVEPAHQSAFSFDGKWQYADKTRLVIFGEYVPGRKWLPFLNKFKLPEGDLVPADEVRTVPVGQFKVGALLCFEGLFPDVGYKHAANGANVIAVMAIDDWYFGTNAPEQLRDAATWRAIEAGVPVVRAASLGYTMIIDAKGRTVAEAPLRESEALVARVKVPRTPQYFPLLPVFPYLSLFSLIAIPLYDALRRRKEG